jgi:hypothetical protein
VKLAYVVPGSLLIELLCVITNPVPFVITEETEKLRAELTQVRTELEPWENQIIEHKGRLDVASAEKELMKQKVSLLYTPHHLFSNWKQDDCYQVLQCDSPIVKPLGCQFTDIGFPIIFDIPTWTYLVESNKK